LSKSSLIATAKQPAATRASSGIVTKSELTNNDRNIKAFGSNNKLRAPQWHHTMGVQHQPLNSK
jgi:hypothetical protein